VKIPKQLVEIYTYDASTKRSLNLAPFDKISESGDGGDSFHIKRKEKKRPFVVMLKKTQNVTSTYHSLLRLLFNHIPKTYRMIYNPATFVFLLCFKTQILNFGVAHFRGEVLAR
jgi:hypothetical protein